MAHFILPILFVFLWSSAFVAGKPALAVALGAVPIPGVPLQADAGSRASPVHILALRSITCRKRSRHTRQCSERQHVVCRAAPGRG